MKRITPPRWGEAAVAVLAAFCIIGDFFLFRSAHFNADNVGSFNELAAIRHGNFALHGWSLTSDNFYLTDLPLYAAVSCVTGRTPALIYLVPYLVFLMFLAGCIGLVLRAGQTRPQRLVAMTAVLLLLGVPDSAPQSIFLVSDVHASSIMYSVYALLMAMIYLQDPRRHPRLALLTGFIILIVAASDPLIDTYLTAGVGIACFVRFWSQRRLTFHESWLAGNIVGFTILGIFVPFLLTSHGGFALQQNFSLQFVSFFPQLAANLRAVWIDLLSLADARAGGLAGYAGAQMIAAAHMVALGVILFLGVKVIWDMPLRREPVIAQWLALGAVTLAVTDIVSQFFALQSGSYEPGMPLGAVRYVTPIFVFLVLAAILEGLRLLGEVQRPRLAKIGMIAAAMPACLMLAGAAQTFARAAAAPEFQANQAQIAVSRWLAARHFTYGIGEYWTAQLITAFSAGQVKTDSVIYTDRFLPGNWVGDMADLNAGRPPQFVVYLPGDSSFRGAGVQPVGLAQIQQWFGPPKALFTVSGYNIAVLRDPGG